MRLDKEDTFSNLDASAPAVSFQIDCKYAARRIVRQVVIHAVTKAEWGQLLGVNAYVRIVKRVALARAGHALAFSAAALALTAPARAQTSEPAISAVDSAVSALIDIIKVCNMLVPRLHYLIALGDLVCLL